MSELNNINNINNDIVEFNNDLRRFLQRAKEQNLRLIDVPPNTFRKTMDSAFRNINNMIVDRNQLIDKVNEAKNTLDTSLDILNKSKDEINKSLKFANRSTIGTLQGLSRDVIQSYHTVPTEEDADILHQHYDELEDIRKPTGGKRKTRRRRRTNKRSIRY